MQVPYDSKSREGRHSEFIMASLIFTISSIVLTGILLLLVLFDITHQRLPDALTLPLALAGLIVTLLIDRDRFWLHAAAAAGGFVALWVLAVVCERIRGRTGLGLGDAKLFGAGGGVWVEPMGLPSVLLIVAIKSLTLARCSNAINVTPTT